MIAESIDIATLVVKSPDVLGEDLDWQERGCRCSGLRGGISRG